MIFDVIRILLHVWLSHTACDSFILLHLRTNLMTCQSHFYHHLQQVLHSDLKWKRPHTTSCSVLLHITHFKLNDQNDPAGCQIHCCLWRCVQLLGKGSCATLDWSAAFSLPCHIMLAGSSSRRALKPWSHVVDCHVTRQGVATSSIGALLRGHGFRVLALKAVVRKSVRTYVTDCDRSLQTEAMGAHAKIMNLGIAAKVTAIKLDPYINIDAGLMSPTFDSTI